MVFWWYHGTFWSCLTGWLLIEDTEYPSLLIWTEHCLHYLLPAIFLKNILNFNRNDRPMIREIGFGQSFSGPPKFDKDLLRLFKDGNFYYNLLILDVRTVYFKLAEPSTSILDRPDSHLTVHFRHHQVFWNFYNVCKPYCHNQWTAKW